jgi:hypothetical protein
MATCAAFIKESRMKFINANTLYRKSGVWGTRPFVRERETTPLKAQILFYA